MSANEKMVMVPRQWAQQTVSAGPGEYLSRSDIDLLSEALNQPAQQGQGESVGWQFYQQGRWWNGDDRIKDHRKNTEEAGIPTRDVFARPVLGQGEPVAWMDPRSPGMHATISNEVKQHNVKFGGAPASAVNGYTIPLYAHADPAEVEGLRRDLHAARVALQARASTFGALRARLAETQALLDRVVDHVKFWHDHPYAECLHGVVRDYQALSASAEPSAPLPPVDGDLLPPINSKVLIHLGREDKWVEHTVVGYYAWGNHGLDQNVHRVFVRVRDAEGYLNARLLSDVRLIDEAPPQL